MFSRSRCEGILSGRHERKSNGHPTGGNEVKWCSIVLCSVIQSSRQDPKLMMVNSCCAFGCNKAVGR